MKRYEKILAAAVFAAVLFAAGPAWAEDECRLSVSSGEDGRVTVTANGQTTEAAASQELWLPNGTLVSVEYIPNTTGDWRCFSGVPAGAEYQRKVRGQQACVRKE